MRPLCAMLAVLCLLCLLPQHLEAANSSDFNVYWGDLHGHTMGSPVQLTLPLIQSYFVYARDASNLDFVALTEKDFDLTDQNWIDLRSQAAAFTATGSFVAFSAYEWGDEGFDAFGHRPVYYLTDTQPLFRSDQASSDHVTELLELVLGQTNGLTAVAHPDLSNFSTDWDYYDGVSDRIAEIYSRHGHFEDGDNGIQSALGRGYRFGFTGVSDTRSGTPGSDGLTAVLATSLSKTQLHTAMRARRVYATTGARIGLWVAADGHEMGQEYATASSPTLAIECTPTAPLLAIEVLKNNLVVYTWQPASKPLAPVISGTPAIVRAGAAKASAGSRPALRSLRHVYDLDAVPAYASLQTDATNYRLLVNGTCVVDTWALRASVPHAAHDCNAAEGSAVAGSVERAHELGCYELAALGARLHSGSNEVVLEFEPAAPGVPEPRLSLDVVTLAPPVAFTWADNNFTGSAYYYVRVTQTDGHQAWASPIWVDRLAPDTARPRAPEKLRASKDGTSVFLDWPKVTKDADGNIEQLAHYRVFRGTTPGFAPDRAGLTNQIATPTSSSYRDTGALSSAVNYYYRVAAVDQAGNESLSHSNLAFKVHRALTFKQNLSNIYWLSLPYEAMYDTADELARDLNGGTSGACTKVLRWDVASQSPSSWVRLNGQWLGSNFALARGSAVAIVISSNLDAVLVGAHENGTSARLTPHADNGSLNWISVPVNTPHFFASSLVNDINDGTFPAIVSRIVRFTSNQSYQSYGWNGSNWTGTNFILVPGEAYGVEAESVFDWVPETLN